MEENPQAILNSKEAQDKETLFLSAYFLIIVMEIFFIMVRSNPNIEGIKILNFLYTLTSYADDTTFFLKNEKSAQQVYATFSEFSNYSGLNINRSKCEFAGIGVKRGVQTALPGVNNIDLKSAAIKILGFSKKKTF